MNRTYLATRAAVAITSAGLFALASPAWGKEPSVFVLAPSDVVVQHIGYADLNLASPAGQERLTTRVKVAVGDLCDEITGGNDRQIKHNVDMRRCSLSAWDQARPQMALAVQRAREIASTGYSSIAASALIITLPR